MSWLEGVTQAVATAANIGVGELTLSKETSQEILDLARIASHESGERINAPLLCYALGIAVGKGASLEDLAAAVRAAG
ncbi:MAG TPA: DUF6457 domain-containing protein [Actinomycetota bacterium]|jgi:hypothetical protein|nr:DUF6457 domain-containing protein [Actinomycetota bacterium]